jgi:enoyl-CoA hydratase/carnithine racemase
MTTAPVKTEVLEGVMVVTINRPEVRNAIDTETAAALAEAMDRLDSSDELMVAVITGSGGNFCAGMDLKAFLAGERPSIEGRGFAGIVERPPIKPLIAAVEGYALAGGFEIVLACDLVVASRDAMFGLPEVRRGLVAAGGGLLRLPERIPFNLATEWALLGEFQSALRGFECGLVNRLAEPGEALAIALQLANSIKANGPLAVRATKQILSERRDWTAAESFDRQRAISEPVRGSDDAREGAQAFREKRSPKWRSR